MAPIKKAVMVYWLRPSSGLSAIALALRAGLAFAPLMSLEIIRQTGLVALVYR